MHVLLVPACRPDCTCIELKWNGMNPVQAVGPCAYNIDTLYIYIYIYICAQ